MWNYFSLLLLLLSLLSFFLLLVCVVFLAAMRERVVLFLSQKLRCDWTSKALFSYCYCYYYYYYYITLVHSETLKIQLFFHIHTKSYNIWRIHRRILSNSLLFTLSMVSSECYFWRGSIAFVITPFFSSRGSFIHKRF